MPAMAANKSNILFTTQQRIKPMKNIIFSSISIFQLSTAFMIILSLGLFSSTYGQTCGIPSNLTSSPQIIDSRNAAILTWQAVAGADHYYLICRPQGNGPYLGSTSYISGDTIYGLQSGVTYEWMVRTFCDAAETNGSGYSSVATFTSTNGLSCDIASGLASSPTTVGAILNWDQVPAVVDYFLIYRLKDSTEPWQGVTTSDTSTVLTGLPQLTTYEWKMKAFCTEDTSPASGADAYYSDLSYFTTETSGQVPDSLEYEALAAFYYATSGGSWYDRTNWLQGQTSTDFATWYGVTVEDGDVIGLEATYNNIIGNIPSEFGNLSNLKRLVLSYNGITSLPSSIDNLTNLDYIDLFTFPVFGAGFGLSEIPAEFGNLINLDTLIFSGTFTELPNEFGNLSSLKKLWILSYDSLTALPSNFWNLTALEDLSIYASISNLSSNVSNLTNLKRLRITADSVTSLPTSIGSLSNLELLVLNLSLSSLPNEIGDLSSLEVLSLIGNELSTLPSSIGNLTNLVTLSLGYNQLSSVPASIGNLSSLINLNLNNNQLTSLPSTIGDLENLTGINLSNNSLSNLPNTIGNLNELTGIDLSSNLFEQLPDEITNLNNLYSLIVNNNLLTALPTNLGAIDSLLYIDARENQLTGLPSSIGNFPGSFLYLDVSNNNIAQIPTEIENLSLGPSEYMYFNISDNRLTDLPNFTLIDNPQNIILIVTNNQLGFGGLEKNFTNIDQTAVYDLQYVPQLQPDTDTLHVVSGQVLVLDANDGATQNNYQWQCGVNGAWADIDGATSSTYSVSLLPDQEDLPLRCVKTNNWVTDITLYSQEFVLYNTNGPPILAENLPDEASSAPQPDGITNLPPINNVIPQAINYVRVKTTREAITSKTVVDGNPVIADVQTSTQYIDGIGRPMQRVIKNESPNGYDVIQPVIYDAFGRIEKEYLPYTKNAVTAGIYQPNALWEQYDFYHTTEDKIANTDFPFTQNGFEDSPRNLLLCQAAPGESWRFGTGHELKFTKRSNISSVDGSIRIWEIANSTALPTTFGSYANGEMFVSENKDEHNNLVIEYTDKLGRVVLKKVQDGEDSSENPTFLQTAYVYDDFNNLRHVIPPEAMTKMINQSDFSLASDPNFADKWLFSYKYDERQRMIEKKVPGAEYVEMIYNSRDLLVMSQDGNHREDNMWLYTKYDALNRPIGTGQWLQSSGSDPYAAIASLQGINLYEEPSGSGYTNRSFPSTNIQVLTGTFYDTYFFLNGLPPQFQYVQELGNGPASTYTKGLVTGSFAVIIGSSNQLYTINYNDDYGRIIQTISNEGGSLQRTTNKLDYASNILETQTTYSNGQFVILRTFTYDDADRLLSITHKVNNMPAVAILENEYNELGNLIKKDLGVDNGQALQSVDYLYNIRGWLTHINDPELSQGDDYFGMELLYDYGYMDNEFNGNIAGTKWQSVLDGVQRTYSYLYDPANRIAGAAYVAKGATVWDQEDDFYDMGLVQYDGNGNILEMARNGLSGYDLEGDPVYEQLDDMSYTYDGNQLTAVNDLITNGTQDRGDFYDGAESSDEYEYDANGNMIRDDNKGIASIEYNYLNLPEHIEFINGNEIKYTYDASGKKYLQKVGEGGQKTKETKYIGELIFEGPGMPDILFEEGIIIPDEAAQVFEYQYYHKDHLGNIRMTFTAPKAAVEYLATMETANATTEETEFSNIAETRQLDALQAYNGVASARLNGADTLIIGPSKSLAVGKGDTVKIEVYAKYNQSTNNTTTLISGLGAAVTDAFGLIGSGETQVAYDAISSLLSAGSGLVSSNDDIPLAYVNYLMFNEDYLLVDFGYQQVSTTALNNPHELLSISTVAPQNGFMYIYLTNESALDLDVFFDDLTITHTKSPIIQEDHYYPFGLTMQGVGKQGSNPFKYNGFEEQDELDLGLYDYQARYYDPALGRFINIDPAADLMRRHSPYNYAFDNPIRFTDPDGMVPEPFTELYDQAGNKIGEDENGADGNIAIVIDATEVARVKENTAAGTHTESSTLNSTVDLPSADIRSQMGDAVDRSNSPTTAEDSSDPNFVADTEGGFHEEGGVYGKDQNGNEVVVNSKPGSAVDPSDSNSEKVGVTITIPGSISAEGTFHVHPGGVKAGKGFRQPVSTTDKTNAEGRNGNSIVLGVRSGKAYIYNSSGTKTTFPLRQFREIGN